MNNYPVYDGDEIIGRVQLLQQGRFWKISCMCKAECKDPLRIRAVWQEGSLELGLCVSAEGGKHLVRRVAMRDLPKENISFCVSKQEESRLDEDGIEIGKISDLRFARLAKSGENIRLEYDQSISRPTGQWSEPMISE